MTLTTRKIELPDPMRFDKLVKLHDETAEDRVQLWLARQQQLGGDDWLCL